MPYPQLPDLPFAVKVTHHPRSRRISVRIDVIRRCVVLNVPKRASMKRAIAFLEKKQGLLEERLAKYQRAPVADGMELNIFGQAYILRCDPKHRGISMDDGVLAIGGQPEFLERRLRDALMKHAKMVFAQKVKDTLVQHGEFAKYKTSVVIRDMRSRWGSCTTRGRLCFNWRLAFAPEFVTDYIVSHELAHLLHHNHGPRFWQQVERMYPRMQEAERWLKRYGNTLYQIP